MPLQLTFSRSLVTLSVLSITVWMAACAPVSRVIMLPQAGGEPSAVVVQAPRGEAVLDAPYAVANVARSGRVGTATTTADEVPEPRNRRAERLVR